ncbi:PhoH family protein [Qingrenia yutianensis]|uniref:PhoH-like protein n=1 Tax=Qingrenia yutianensis TaxID=2763676 RepID=A0A926IRZ9_9FIRM|nr:PhoH family protein [Qingrenia yutianensis]MBC8595859.1 PhoH family protein [Qingrenia yutianensis]
MERNISLQNGEQILAVFGDFDKNLKKIQTAFDVSIVNRGGDIKISGGETGTALAQKAIESLAKIFNTEGEITDQAVNYTIDSVRDGIDHEALYGSDCVCITAKGKPIKSKTMGQKKYVEAIKNNTITFGIGPAGTGKTYLAVALAVKAFKNKEVSRIILTRPAVEAGEKLGFLPGDLQNKVDPYLRPLYDALYEMFGFETYQKHVERGSIEVAPLAYMRGRTIDDSFIILDEAQNTTPEQMKMFLTRVGFNSRVIVTGDVTQIDLPDGKKSGLKEVEKILKDIDGISFCYLSDKDVVRHQLVQKIIKAYDRFEQKKLARQNEKRGNR